MSWGRLAASRSWQASQGRQCLCRPVQDEMIAEHFHLAHILTPAVCPVSPEASCQGGSRREAGCASVTPGFLLVSPFCASISSLAERLGAPCPCRAEPLWLGVLYPSSLVPLDPMIAYAGSPVRKDVDCHGSFIYPNRESKTPSPHPVLTSPVRVFRMVPRVTCP